MQIMHPQVSLLFPLRQFLTQPLFGPIKVILNPLQFQKHYYVQHLERCWTKEVELKSANK